MDGLGVAQAEAAAGGIMDAGKTGARGELSLRGVDQRERLLGRLGVFCPIRPQGLGCHPLKCVMGEAPAGSGPLRQPAAPLFRITHRPCLMNLH